MMPVCKECSLKGRPLVKGHGNRNSPRIAFVGEAPGRTEVEAGRPFVGMAGKIIREVAKFAEIPDTDVYFTNSCLCRPYQNNTPSASDIRACYPRLEHELQEVNPQFVVALGATAGSAIFKEKTSMEAGRGYLRDTKLGVPGFLTYHPAVVLYPAGETKFPTLLGDIRKLWRLACGETFPYEDIETTNHIIDTDEKMLDLLDRLKDVDMLLYDWETRGTSPLWGEGWCVGLCWEVGTTYTIPVEMIHAYKDQFNERLRHIQAEAFNAMFDCKFNELEGLLPKIDGDPMLMHYALDERPQRRSLENLSVEWLNAPKYETEMLAQYGCNKSNMIDVVPYEKIHLYCGKDVDFGLRLRRGLFQELEKYPTVKNMYENLLIPGARVFADIQQNGVWVDKGALKEKDEDYRSKIEGWITNLRYETGNPEFNPNSHPQVQAYLWDELGLKEPSVYGRKPRSADEATREALMESYPDNKFVHLLHEYKHDYTMYSRYVRGLPQHINPDGRVRCQYHLDRSETGRLSATNPPIHQIPREVREVFAAPPNSKILKADYEQIEIRMAAHIAHDSLLTELISSGVDFHTKMASEAFRISVEDVTPEKRQAAKAVSFGLLYLMGDKKLASGTGLPPADALEFVKKYKALMPDVQKWITKTKNEVKHQRYVESIFGRRRRFPLITRQNLDGLHREAVNFPIQSAASDLTLCSIIKLHDIFKHDYRNDVKIIIMVHDSIIVECPDKWIGEVSELMKEVMTDPPFETEVPFEIELKETQHWS